MADTVETPAGTISVSGEHEIIARLCRASFCDFVREFWDEVPGTRPLVWNWHMGVICDELQGVAERVIRGLPVDHDTIFNVPYGTSKSTLCSILFPAWVWSRMPKARFVCASHADELVLELSGKSREVLRSEKYQACFPEVRLSPSQDAKGHFRNTEGGERYTCTVAGKSPIGRHGDFLIVDDPLDPKKARSQAELRIAEDFMTQVLPGRKVDKTVSVTVLVMQRLAVGDPTDVALIVAKRPGATPVRHFCLPGVLENDKDRENVSPQSLLPLYAAAENGDLLMDPVRLPPPVLAAARATLQEYGFAAQVKQDPFSSSGGMFKPWYFGNRVRAAPYDAKRILYVDRAGSTDDRACNTAITLMAKGRDGSYYVERCLAGRWEPDERNRMIRAEAQRCRDRYTARNEPAVWVEMEGGSSGRDAWKGIVRALAGFTVREHNVSRAGNKVTRAEPWSCQLAAGNVFVVDQDPSAPWDVEAYVSEHVQFPNGPLMDRVDSSSGAFSKLTGPVSSAPQARLVRACGGRKGQLRVVVCRAEDLHIVRVGEDRRCLLVIFNDPGAAVTEAPAAPGVAKLDAHAALAFADADARDYQDRWDVPAEPWGVLPETFLMGREHGRSLWAFLFKTRHPPADTWIFADAGPTDRRAYSAAKGACAALGLREDSTVARVSAADSMVEANRHVADLVRTTRVLVM